MATRQNGSSRAAESGTPGRQPGNQSGVSASVRTGGFGGRGGGQGGPPRGNRGGSTYRGRGWRGRAHRGPRGFGGRGGGRRRGRGYGATGGYEGREDNREQSVPGKRARDDSQGEEDAIGRASRLGLSGQVKSERLSRDQIQVDRDIHGAVVDVKASDPRGPKNFSTPSIETPGAMDVVMNSGEAEGWSALADVCREYREMGSADVVVTFQPLGKPSER